MYHKTVLKNGVRVVTEQLDHMPSVSLGIWVNAGSRNEDREENGVFHFIEHMIFKGTNNRSSLQIAKELDAIGGLSNAFTGKENTCFHARVLGKHFTRLADVFSDIFLHSTFDFNDLERERQVIIQEIGMAEDAPDDHIHILFNRQFWSGHPIGMSVLGTEKSVSAIEKKTILKYINHFYIPEKIIVAAAGDVDHQSMVSYFEPLFSSLKGENLHLKNDPPRSNAGVSVQYRDLEQVHICMGGEAPSQTSDKRFACAVLNTILGGNMSSRLFQEIRENRGLAYSVFSFFSAYNDAGLLGVYVATDKQNVNPVLEAIKREINTIRNGNISKAELAAAVDHLVGGIFLASESTDNRMMRMAKNEFVYQRYISYEEIVSELEKVTVDNVVDVANGIFGDGNVSLATLGPIKEEALDKGNLRF